MLLLKGFAMGAADIIPGVSGGTVAFITGIYDELVKSIASVDKVFLGYLFKAQFKQAFDHINLKFLLPLFIGILTAIILLSKLMHFLINDYPVYTWALFFGLILASIRYLYDHIKNPIYIPNLMATAFGALLGFLLVSLVPVQTPNSYPIIFGVGCIAICAMILPGISGSFLLLIFGKYEHVTGALKSPLYEDNLIIIAIFAAGCLIGLLSFSKILNYLLSKYHNLMMCILTGFMIGSIKKLWPWRDILESTIIRDKVHVLKEANYIPDYFDAEVGIAIFLMLLGFAIVESTRIIAHKKQS
jgi:putative membrane protein